MIEKLKNKDLSGIIQITLLIIFFVFVIILRIEGYYNSTYVLLNVDGEDWLAEKMTEREYNKRIKLLQTYGITRNKEVERWEFSDLNKIKNLSNTTNT